MRLLLSRACQALTPTNSAAPASSQTVAIFSFNGISVMARTMP
jgi:hypothetical protein